MERVTVPHAAKCEACGDFGTIVLGDGKRGELISEIMRSEMPCTCIAGDLWREIFAEWERPVSLKAAKKSAAVVIDPKWKQPEPVALPRKANEIAKAMGWV